MSRLPQGDRPFPAARSPTQNQRDVTAYAYSYLQTNDPDKAEAAARAVNPQLTPGEILQVSIKAHRAILAGNALGEGNNDLAQFHVDSQGVSDAQEVRYLFKFKTVDSSGNEDWHTAVVSAPQGETMENLRLRAEVYAKMIAEQTDTLPGANYEQLGTGLVIV